MPTAAVPSVPATTLSADQQRQQEQNVGIVGNPAAIPYGNTVHGDGGEVQQGSVGGGVGFSAQTIYDMMNQVAHNENPDGSTRPGLPAVPAEGGAITSLPTDHGSGQNDLNHSMDIGLMDHGAKGNQQIRQALQNAGATPAETSVIQAMGMQETNNLDENEISSYTRSKTGAGANYSIFNLNPSEIALMGGPTDQAGLSKLNSVDSNSDATSSAAQMLLRGIRTYGVDNVMTMTRGGSSGVENSVDPATDNSGVKASFSDIRKWGNGQIASANYLQQHAQAPNGYAKVPAPEI